MKHRPFVLTLLISSLALGNCGRASPPHIIVCFGDSLTAGRGAQENEAWPALVGKQTKARVINAGKSGDTTEDALARVDEILALNPDTVIVEFGANDLLRAFRGEQTPDFAAIAANLDFVLEALRKDEAGGGRKLYLVKFYDPRMVRDFADGGGELLGTLETLYDSLGAAHEAEIIDGIWNGVWGTPGLMSDDIHPNARGYRIMAENYLNALGPYLKESGLLR